MVLSVSIQYLFYVLIQLLSYNSIRKRDYLIIFLKRAVRLGRVVGGIEVPSPIFQTQQFREFAIATNVRDIRSFATERNKIWENAEPSPEPYIPCYTPRRPKGGERSVARSEAE